MKMPSFTPYCYSPPAKIEPLIIKPLASLRPPAALSLTPDLLSKMGVK